MIEVNERVDVDSTPEAVWAVLSDPHAVVDEKTASDPRAGVYLYSGQPAPDMGNKSPQPLESVLPQSVRHPMHDKRVESRIAGHHLPDTAGGGVTVEDD